MGWGQGGGKGAPFVFDASAGTAHPPGQNTPSQGKKGKKSAPGPEYPAAKGSKGSKGGKDKFRKPSEDVPDFAGSQLAGAEELYTVGPLLGAGTFGKVFELAPRAAGGKSRGSGKQLCVKIMEPRASYMQFDNDAPREAAILRRVQEADVGNACLEFYFSTQASKGDRPFVCVVTERLSVPLHACREEFAKGAASGLFSVADAFRQLLRQVGVLHGIGFVHTDVKHKNVMVHLQTGAVKLIDYGSGVFPGDARPAVIVTKPFRPPEMYLKLPWGKPADLFALAMTVAWLAAGREAFSANLGTIPGYLAPLAAKFSPFVPDTSVPAASARPLRTILLNANVPRADSLSQVLTAMLALDPDQRLSAEKALKSPYFVE
ncbi:Serine/threonine-protein kinase AFC3 [Diplonema papillatum]|nr:Serine/threonine-protein kinase AFC3 [Diplonema papillatum]|eukprot:gene23069-35348_t